MLPFDSINGNRRWWRKMFTTGWPPYWEAPILWAIRNHVSDQQRYSIDNFSKTFLFQVFLINSGRPVAQLKSLHSQAVSEEVLSIIKPTHPRMVRLLWASRTNKGSWSTYPWPNPLSFQLHLSWEGNQTFLPFYIERLFSLPRDAEILCKQINTEYQSWNWQNLQVFLYY